ARNARVTINAVHPGIVKTGIIRAHKGLITGCINYVLCGSQSKNRRDKWEILYRL
ncbi:hypothetical protein SESBI_42007, partial [Sesbania bispinosa]